MSDNKIIVILGPTASGKSEVAIKLAKKFDGEVISADSRQIYMGMNLGTGKITKNEMRGVKHWMLDIVSPKTDYNAAKFKKAVDKIIPNILRRGKVPIICGGTGFWIKAIVDNVNFPAVRPDWKLRKTLDKKNITELIQQLKKLDPQRLKTIDRNNKVRLIRAIEIAKSLGHVPRINPRSTVDSSQYKFLQIGISLPKARLHKNIKKRLDARFKQGMIQETRKLHQQGLSWKKIQSFGLGYYWIPMYLKNKISNKELIEKVYQAEKDYAKRQMTWFKKDKRIIWLKNWKGIEKETYAFMKKDRP